MEKVVKGGGRNGEENRDGEKFGDVWKERNEWRKQIYGIGNEQREENVSRSKEKQVRNEQRCVLVRRG